MTSLKATISTCPRRVRISSSMFAICNWSPSQPAKSKNATFGFILQRLRYSLYFCIIKHGAVLADVDFVDLAVPAFSDSAFHSTFKRHYYVVVWQFSSSQIIKHELVHDC